VKYLFSREICLLFILREYAVKKEVWSNESE